jgi:peroxiredoxin
MRMQKVASLSIVLTLAASALATALVPRKSPEFIIVEPFGRQILLSSLKGKVVVIEFLLTNCPRCWRVAQMVTKLHKELGPRGFQPIGIAFDNNISGPAVSEFVRSFKVGYPVGYTSSEKVDRYLGRSAAERFRVPQIVVIDRRGVIRAQSRPQGESNLENENYLRNLIDSLLKESAPAANTKKTTAGRR